MTPESFQSRYPQLWTALIAMASGDSVYIAASTKAEIKAELEALNTTKEQLREPLGAIVGDDPTPEHVMLFSMRAYQFLGANDETRGFVGRLWAELMKHWSKNDRAHFLQLTAADPHKVFWALDFSAEMLMNEQLSASEALPWLMRARRLVANDLVQRGFWNSVQAFCKADPDEAITLAESWLQGPDDPGGLDVIAAVLGIVRAPVVPGTKTAERLANLETRLRTGHPSWRALYIRSFFNEASSIAETEALAIRDACFRRNADEETSWILLLCAVAQRSTNSWDWVMAELRSLVRATLPIAAKSPIVVTVFSCIEQEEQRAGEWLEILIGILPINADQAQLWEHIEQSLAALAEQKDRESTRGVINALAQHSGQSWLTIAKGRQFAYLYSILHQTGLGALVSGDLCFADNSQSRRLGLLFFERCGVEKFDPSVISRATPVQLELLLLEAQRFPIDSSALARLHACLAERIDQSGGELLFVFYDEVALQALNTYGYRSTLATHAPQHEYLRAILQDVEDRLGKMRKVVDSFLVEMDVPHRRTAEVVLSQRMNREIAKGIDKYSVLVKLMPKVILLYGKQWRTFRPDGTLTEGSGLKEVVHDIEVPRLDLFDPEGMQLRRLEASVRIARLESGVSDAQDED